jgi:hypothetical protein
VRWPRSVGPSLLIPTALFDDRFLSPGALGDGSDLLWHAHELVPGLAAGIDDALIALPHTVAEPVAAEKLPYVLHPPVSGKLSGAWI